LSEHRTAKGLELTKQLLELSGKVIGILPLGDPCESFNWELFKQKTLTKEDTTELMRLAQEIKKVREQLDNL
jgi:hypothetical protein